MSNPIGFEQLLNFPAKTVPVAADIIYIGDSASSFNEVKSTITQLTTAIQSLLTFPSGMTSTATTNQLILGTTHTVTINAQAPSANRIYAVPDIGLNANFVLSQGTQSIGGAITFVNPVVFSNASPIKMNGGGSTNVILKIVGPLLDNNYTFPDAGRDANILLDQGVKTIAGVTTFADAVTFSSSPTFSNTVTINPVSSQLILGGVSAGKTTTISATAPANNSVYTIPDVGTSANFILSTGTQSVGGALTLSGTVVYTNANPIKMNGGGSTFITLTINGPVTDRVYTFPDVSTDANVLLSRYITSTIATTGATNPTAANSGTIIGIPVLTGNATATLPAVASSTGLRFRYVCTNGVTALGHTFIISTTDSKVLSGNFMVVSTNTQALFGTTNTLTFSATTAGSGDWLEFYCLNGKWNVSGSGFSSASITVA